MALSSAQEKRLRSLLGRSVPKEYSQLLRVFPTFVYEKLGERGADEEQPLFREAKTVIVENEKAREEEIWTEAGPWPEGHLMIGAELGGDKFTLNVGEKPARVYRLLHESAQLERVGTLSSYLQAIRRWLRGEAATITEALRGRAKKKKGKAGRQQEPAWVIARRKLAAKAPAQERKAARTNVAEDWGDAAVYYEAGSRLADAIRCCERWIELSPSDAFPACYKVQLLSRLVSHEMGYLKKPELDAQYRELFPDLATLHAAHILAAKGALAATKRESDPDARREAKTALEWAERMTRGVQKRRPGKTL